MKTIRREVKKSVIIIVIIINTYSNGKSGRCNSIGGGMKLLVSGSLLLVILSSDNQTFPILYTLYKLDRKVRDPTGT